MNLSNFDEYFQFWKEYVSLIFYLLQEARMAAKLLEKKFGIKDVSWDKFHNFYQCYGCFGPRLFTGWNQRTLTMMESWVTRSSIGPSKNFSRSLRMIMRRRKSNSCEIQNKSCSTLSYKWQWRGGKLILSYEYTLQDLRNAFLDDKN